MSRNGSACAEPRRSIPDAVIQSVKNNTSFLSLLNSYGIAAAKKGKDYFAICPFHRIDGHPEKTASLSIDITTNLYHCFSCNARGNVIQFVMDMEKVTFPEAVEKLLAIKGAGIMKVEKEDTAETRAAISEEQRQAILAEILRRSIEDLRNSDGGRRYLEGRGLEPLTLLESYTFGFWNGKTFDKLESGEKKKLQGIGLVNGNRALFENCIVFPLQKEGRIATIYGRKTVESGTAEGRHYLLPHRREGLYLPKQGLNPQRPIIITESIIDGLSLFAAGVTNVLPLLGVNGFLPDHLAYLKQQNFPQIFIALNGDEAGNRAAAALKEQLAQNGLLSEIVELPDSKDINDMLREMGAAKLKAWCEERTGNKQADPGPRPTVSEDDRGGLFVLFEDREYRIQGLALVGMERLRANIKLYRMSDKNLFYVDTLDLYQAKAREHFIAHAAETLKAEARIISHDVNALITVLEEIRLQKKEESDKPPVYVMSDEEERAAREYLSKPNLLARIAADFEACGMVGDRNNCLIAFLIALSRLLDRALGALTISRSAAGKSYLQNLVAKFIPTEWLCPLTYLSGQSLFYKAKNGIRRKVLVIEEDEGMKNAMFAIRVLLSSQRLHLQSIRHDAKSGEMRDYENVVEGPASILIAGTDRAAFDDETASRFFTLHMDESPEQTKRILDYLEKLDSPAGIILREHQKPIIKMQQNIQRLLKPVLVANPIGTGIKYPVEILRCRREKGKIQTLIKAVALLHQYQREVKEIRVLDGVVKYIEVAQSDVDAVKELAGEILRQSLDDLSKMCRELLEHIHELVDMKYAMESKSNAELERWHISFTRKELMERSRWSRWHLEEHLDELEKAGYIAHRMGKKGQRFCYSLVDESLPDMPEIA